MSALHGILAELGIEAPHMHAGNAQETASQWVTDQPFAPVEGRSYELAYDALPGGGADGVHPPLLKRVRIDGPSAGDWYDLEAGAPLAPELRQHAVRGFRELPP